MFKFNWLPKKIRRTGNTLVALDIGTEFIKAFLVQIEGNMGHVLGFSRVRQDINEMQNGVVTDIAGVIAKCREAIDEAEHMAGVHGDHVILGVAGELVKGATRTIRYRRHDPQAKIHLEELKNIIHKVQWKAFEQMRKELAHETGYTEMDIKLVSASIIDIRVDDYPVVNPIGFQGKEILINTFNAFSPLTYYGVIQSIAAELSRDLLGIMAEPYALTRVLESDRGESKDSIFIDIGGGTTDVAVLRDGLLLGTKMFTIGGRSFTKRISRELNVSFGEAEAIKLAYCENRLEKQSHKTVQKALKHDMDVWMTGIHLTLSEFLETHTLPSSILLCGGGSMLPEIKTALTESDWWKSLQFTRQPDVKSLMPSEIPLIKDHSGQLHSAQDITPMALARIGIELHHEEKVLNKILRKVVRLMQV